MLIGHQEQWQLIKGLAGADVLPHAFLFSGQSEIGKKKFAMELAKFLQCEEEKSELRPCGICRACKSVEAGAHPDVALVRSDGKEIQIAQIRKLSGGLFFKPAFDRIKVVIIDEAHKMNAEAQNALLKTLEEPKGNALLVLVSSKPEMLLPTTRSRALQVKFYPVSQEKLEMGLSRLEVSADKIKKIAELSFGKPGRAIKLANDESLLGLEIKTRKEFEALLRSSLALRFRYAKKITGEADKNLHDIIEVWLRYLRGAAHAAILSGEGQNNAAKFLKAIRRLQETDYLLATTTVNPRLAIETFFLEL